MICNLGRKRYDMCQIPFGGEKLEMKIIIGLLSFLTCKPLLRFFVFRMFLIFFFFSYFLTTDYFITYEYYIFDIFQRFDKFLFSLCLRVFGSFQKRAMFALINQLNAETDINKCNPKLFVDDTSLSSVVKNISVSQNELNEDLAKTNNWAYQWKFYPDSSKQTQEISFSRKVNDTFHLSLSFRNSNLTQVNCEKSLSLHLIKRNSKFTFISYLEKVLEKVKRGICTIRKPQPVLSRSVLLTIYKPFLCPFFVLTEET